MLLANAKSACIGQEKRNIKALSEKIEGYLEGKSLGYTKSAELNKYPGPRHVLDLASELSLTQDQKAKTQQLFYFMQKQAIDYGKKLIQKEQKLDSEFATSSTDLIRSDASDPTGRVAMLHVQTPLRQGVCHMPLTEKQTTNS